MSNWQPLESNSELITNYLSEIGLDTSIFKFQDLLSYEEWAQEMILDPILGLLFIYEVTQNQKDFKNEQADKIIKEGQVVSPEIFYMKQYAHNACGTIGVFHILGNLPKEHKELIKKDSLLDQFFDKAKGKTPEEIGKLFEGDKDIKDKHVVASNEGTSNVENHQKTNNHFIAIVAVDGHLYELDGGKSNPINHGSTSSQTFLSDACKVAHSFIMREPGNVNAGLIVLAPKIDEGF